MCRTLPETLADRFITVVAILPQTLLAIPILKLDLIWPILTPNPSVHSYPKPSSPRAVATHADFGAKKGRRRRRQRRRLRWRRTTAAAEDASLLLEDEELLVVCDDDIEGRRKRTKTSRSAGIADWPGVRAWSRRRRRRRRWLEKTQRTLKEELTDGEDAVDAGRDAGKG